VTHSYDQVILRGAEAMEGELEMAGSRKHTVSIMQKQETTRENIPYSEIVRGVLCIADPGSAYGRKACTSTTHSAQKP
jgi:hypothetical protein